MSTVPLADPAALCAAVASVVARVPSVRLAYVFGSRIVGRPRDDSDLDLAVLYDRALGARAREEARRDLLDLLTEALGRLGERADIVDLARCDSAVAFAAIRDGKLVYASDEDERIQTVSLIARRYDDDTPKRALFREAARRVGS